MNRTPSISLIIPTHQRSPMLFETVRALRDLDHPAARLEIIIVTDHLGVSLQETIARIKLPFSVQLIEQSGQGAAIRRNCGAKQARGELLIFLDDDMTAAPRLAAAHAEAHGKTKNRVVIGYIPPVPTGRVGLLQLELRDWWEDNFNKMRAPGHLFTYQDLYSGNFSLRRELFEHIGGFRSDYQCREDYELGIRLLAAGAQFVYHEEARCIHRDRTEIGHALQRKQQEGAAEVQLGLEYPQLRGQLLMTTLLVEVSPVGKFLRILAFHWPGIGDWLVGWLRSWLFILERMKLRLFWRRLQLGLSFYSYWRGVATRLPDVASVRAFLDITTSPKPFEPELVLDLAQGIAAAEQVLDAVHPASVKLTYKGLPIGVIPSIFGAERLRGPHLRTYLLKNFSLALARARLRELLASLPIPAASQMALCPYKGFQTIELAGWPIEDPVSARLSDSPRTLLRLLGRPLRWVTNVASAGPNPGNEQQAETFYNFLLPALFRITPASAQPVTDPAVPFSVIVCTRDRPHLLSDCLQALAGLDYPRFEILVIDNAPSSSATERLCAQHPVRYVREDRPGLDVARNTGWQLASGSLVAFTDDDARPDPGWLAGLAAAFEQPEVMAVTGPVLPCELNTPAQIAFEEAYGGMSHGFDRHSFYREELSDRELLWASGFGVGANMAFRRTILADLGGFDPALDVGTPAAGGGDVELFHRLVARGNLLIYTPDAPVWHLHRRGWEELKQQIYNNGRSFGVYLFTCRRNRTISLGSLIRFIVWDWFGKWLLWRLIHPGKWPRRLVLTEILGALSAPAAYAQSRRAVFAQETQYAATDESTGNL
ncbi:MAG: glycosyltransferase [Anaerolineales bacterium]